MTVVQPQSVQLMQMLQPEASIDAIMNQLQAAMPASMAGAFMIHLIYGAVLGNVSTAIRKKIIAEREMHGSESSVYSA